MRTSIFLILFSFSIMGFSQSPPTYEYLSMTQFATEITLNLNSESFERINIKDEKSRDNFDFSPILKRIEEYEKQGYELVSNNMGFANGPHNYVLMRRKK